MTEDTAPPMMSSVLYLVGAPGVGKSTAIEMLLADYQVAPFQRPPGYGTFGYEPLLVDRAPVGAYLGRHRADFSGTDALAMSVMPHAVRWAEEAELPPVVFGEGARLSAPKFWLPLHRRARLVIVHLTADPYTHADRRARRNNTQNPTWMKGAETRAANVAKQAANMGMQVWTLNTTAASPEQVGGWLAEILDPA